MSDEVYIPNFSYPFDNITTKEQCEALLGAVSSGNYLFTQHGLWHGGVHFTGTALIGVDTAKGIRCIADGELVAYRVNSEYLQNKYEAENQGFYSTGFMLVRHKLRYPKDKLLTFFSLYMHIGKLNYAVKTNNSVIRDAAGAEKGKLKTGTLLLLDDSEEVEIGGYKRYKILSIFGEETGANARYIYTKAVEKLATDNKVVIPASPMKVYAGDPIAPVGEYTLSKMVTGRTANRKLLHLEVFTADDIEAFISNAQEKYPGDTTEDRPYPTSITIPKETPLYALEDQLVAKTRDSKAEIKAYTTAADGTTTCTNATTRDDLKNGHEIEVDTSVKVCNNRYKVTKIEKKVGDAYEMEDVSANNWSIYHKSVATVQVPRAKETDPKTQAEETTLKLEGLKKIFYKDQVYLLIDDATAVLYNKCKEHHPVEFRWAKVVKDESMDKFSIFKDVSPMVTKEGELEMSPMFDKLFKAMDELGAEGAGKNNQKLEFQELSAAAGNINVKRLASRMIVQHSSEWHSKENMAISLMEEVQKYKPEEGMDQEALEALGQHYKNESERVNNLEFFSKCSGATGVTGFPTSDVVYHINPIEMISQFRHYLITEEMIDAICPSCAKKHELIRALNHFCPQYQINTPLRIAHFLAQAAHESKCFSKFVEDDTYRESVALQNTGYNAYRQGAGASVTLPTMVKDGVTIQLCKQPEYFNYKYAGSNGNGIASTGDGYKYRGRGLIQLTGRQTYKDFATSHNKRNPEDQQDFETNPDLIKDELSYAVESACDYWVNKKNKPLGKKLNQLADDGSTDETLLKISGTVNGYHAKNASEYNLLPDSEKAKYTKANDDLYIQTPNGYDEEGKPYSRRPLFHKLKEVMEL